MAHFNAADVYRGSYVRFHTLDKKTGGALAGPDNAVGDIGTLEWDFDENGIRRCWLVNPYGTRIGQLDSNASHPFALLDAKGWTVRYVLSFVAYSDESSPSCYWGEAAIIGFSPRYSEQFERFLASFAQIAGDGMRPDPNLNPASIEAIIENPESWKPAGKVKLPQGDGRTAILKDHRTIHDKILDQARKKNPGCYVISWIFIAALVVGIIFLIRSLGLL